MKTVIYFTTAILLLTFSSCAEKDKTATVIKDCSGTYLRIDKKDYHVCNLETVDGFKDGTTITVAFKKLTACDGSANDAVICYMLHENEGWIEVETINGSN
ncbi:hypothetical protein BH11BAC7_BH11BAC7_15510 [soil metagenome]